MAKLHPEIAIEWLKLRNKLKQANPQLEDKELEEYTNMILKASLQADTSLWMLQNIGGINE